MRRQAQSRRGSVVRAINPPRIDGTPGVATPLAICDESVAE